VVDRRRRRRWIGSGAAAGLATAGMLIYRSGPALWQQYTREWKRPITPPTHAPDVLNWPDEGLQAAWIGHSTVLLKIDGFTILTDPVFSSRAGIHLAGVASIGVKRLVEPALDLMGLPEVDLVLLSHAHMDHFDLPSLRYLESKKRTVVTATHTADLLRVRNYKQVHEIGWGQEVRVGPALIRAVEVNHWGARVRTDTFRGFNGYVIEVGRHRVLFAGDTADTHKLRGITDSRGIDLALMPIGAYDPWVRFHCTPEQAWRMANEARAEFFFPIHHQTFQLSREPMHEPIERLYDAAGSAGDRIAITGVGQEWRLG
jgi:L-ascorbate metabolism protein UlaG (beta-lactamase superfamily)